MPTPQLDPADIVGQLQQLRDTVDALASRTGIRAGSIRPGALSAGSVGAIAIANGVVQVQHIAAGTITGDRLQVNTITAREIASGTITAAHIAAGTITATNIAAGTITGALIASGTLTGDKLVIGTVTADKMTISSLSAISSDMGTITAGTITGGTIRTAANGPRVALGNAIVTSQGTYTGLVGVDGANDVTFLIDASTGAAEFKGALKAGSTGLGNIAGQIDGATAIVIGTVTGNRLVVDAITARELSASSVTAVKLSANSVVAGKIAAGTITAAEIATGAITADKLTATAIDGMTITGAVVRTAASGARVLLDSGGLKQYNAANVLLTHLKTDGTANFVRGRILADGLDLQASINNASFDTSRAVNWAKEDGALLAQVQGVNISNAGSSNVSALKNIVHPASDTHGAQITMTANASAGNLRQAGLTVERTSFDTSTKVSVQARSGVSPFNFPSRTVLDAAERSSFLQVGQTWGGSVKSVAATAVLQFAAGAVTSAALNLAPPAPVTSVLASFATCNSYTGLGCAIEAIGGGNFTQFIGYLRAATAGAISVTFSYIIIYS